MGGELVSDSDWEAIRAFLAESDEKREVVIKKSRDLQKLAKQAIYSLHRGDDSKAEAQLQSFRTIATELQPLFDSFQTLRTQGAYSAALEEYAEAIVFQVYLREKRLVRSDELAPLVNMEEYLGGVLDFTGELGRYAIARATQRDSAAVEACRDLVDRLMGQFLSLDLRNGALRKKYDALKYTLKKLENTLYELSLTEAMGGLRREGAGGGDHDPEEQGGANGKAAENGGGMDGDE